MKGIKYVFFLLIILAFGYCFLGQTLLPADELDQRNICEKYTGKWYMEKQDGKRIEIDMPGRYEKGKGVLVTEIPSGMDERISCLCFRGQDMQVYLDGELIYEYSTQNTRWFGEISPENYLTIPLTSSDVGKELRIEFITNTGILYQPYVGSELGMWRYLISIYAGELGVALVTLIMGSLTIVISTVYGWVNRQKMDIVYLGGGVTLSAIWLIANSVFRQIIFPNVSVASDMPFLMVMLIPFPFIIYMNEIQQERYVKLYRVVGIAMAMIDVIVCTLYILGIRELEVTFLWVAYGCIFAISSVIYTFIVDFKKGKMKEYHYVAMGLLGAFLASIVQLVLYFNRTGIFRGSYLAFGLLVLLIGALIHTVHYIFSMENDKKAAILANESKSKFLANMSHEIRTPINAVLGMDEMILRESKELSVREYALDIQNAGKSLLALINDILDISKIDSGKLEIIPVEYDVSSMIHDTVNMIYQKAYAKSLSLTLEVDENLPSRLKGDDVRIRQILLNILNNAVKYTEKGGITLTVSGKKQGKKARIGFAVKDTGIGIKEEDLPKLFEEFRRIEESRHHNVEGTGLGMSITVQLLKLMGSRLELTSRYGEGSCFFFELEQEIVDEIPVGNLSERIKNQEEEYVYETTFTAPDADLLVVDDNAVNRKVLRNLLKDTLIRIDEADSGEECLQKVVHKKYDLIFMDHMMPGKDGIETLHEFPNQEGNRNLETPVIALTANAVTGAKEMFLENGFDDFFTKPIVYHKLEQTIRKHLPKDKIEEGAVLQSFEVSKREAQRAKEIQELLEKVTDLNLEYAYIHNKSAEDLYSVIVDFVQMAAVEADALNTYNASLQEVDSIRQYRVKVHSMKTSAAMIGALQVSGLAKVLEYAARDEKTDTIAKLHEVFIEEWNKLAEKLKEICPKEQQAALEMTEADYSKLNEWLQQLSSAMEEYDVDAADEMLGNIMKYHFEEPMKTLVDKMSTAVKCLDADAVAKCVDEFMGVIETNEK